VENWSSRKERKKGPKKERKESLVETDASDGNPLTTRIPTAAWKAKRFPPFPQGRRRRSHHTIQKRGHFKRGKEGDILKEL
jgi:hypothetical protein